MALCRDRIREVLKLMTRDDVSGTQENENVDAAKSVSSTVDINQTKLTSSISKLSKQKKNKSKEQAPLFDVILSLDDISKELVLYPSVTDIQDAMQQLIQDIFSVVLHPPVFSLQDDDLKVFTQVLF